MNIRRKLLSFSKNLALSCHGLFGKGENINCVNGYIDADNIEWTRYDLFSRCDDIEVQ